MNRSYQSFSFEINYFKNSLQILEEINIDIVVEIDNIFSMQEIKKNDFLNLWNVLKISFSFLFFLVLLFKK